MAKIVEPPVLMSRILTFVLAASVVVLCSLGFTLMKMIPLERPEVFFLYTPTLATNVTIKPLVPDASNKNVIDAYQKGFVRQYMIARNTLETTPGATRSNWIQIVQPWSSNKVFDKLSKTRLYTEFAFGEKMPTVTCRVNFASPNNDEPVLRMTSGTYQVKFTWICENISGQTKQKDYIIQVKIKSDLDKNTSGTLGYLDKLRDNPLGLQVVQYDVLGGGVDPLDTDTEAWFGKDLTR